MTAVLLLLLALMPAIDLSAVTLPTLDAVRAEIARRAPIWQPQHGKTCKYHRSKRNNQPLGVVEWRADPCHCPQTNALHCQADILGYGGAAGGGKSDLLVGTALTQHRRAIIFRRQHTETRDFLARASEIVSATSDAKVNHGLTTVYLPRGDRQLEFAGIKNPDDWTKYKGRAKDFYGFDEADEFEEMMIRLIIAWNRSTIPGQRCRVILTFNPPSATTGYWIVQFFAPWLDPKYPNPAQYGELRWFTTINGRDIEVNGPDPVELRGEKGDEPGEPCQPIERDHEGKCAHCGNEIVEPLSRTFIKALLNDNEYLRDTKYRATLMGLPEPRRSQLLYGDFNAQAQDDAKQLIPTKWVLEAQDRWLKMAHPEAPLSAVGADIARGGKDRTAFVGRIGTWYAYPVAYPGAETPKGKDVLERLAKYVGENFNVVQGRKIPVGMDVIGVGSSPQDILEEIEAVQLIPMSGGGVPEDYETDASGMLTFVSMRAMWYWRLREELNPETGSNLALPPSRELLADLCAPHFEIRGTVIYVEKKEDIQKRIHRSPDVGDALVYAFAARPLVVGYQTVQKRPSMSHIASPLRSSWKRQRGM
jgi:hypothetical protein